MSKILREWLVKNFVLSYRIKLFGINFNIPRFNIPMLITFLLTALSNIFIDKSPEVGIITWILFISWILTLYIKFVYFKFYPAVWNELDDYQKYIYGRFPNITMTSKQTREWIKLKNKYEIL